MDPHLSPAARAFLEQTTLKSLLGISERTLSALRALAHQLYRAARHAEVEVICRGLIAADQHAWWPHALYAAALRRQGQPAAALAQAERALSLAPGQPTLLALTAELRAVLTTPRRST
jgi:predicted Zn-dependent protease